MASHDSTKVLTAVSATGAGTLIHDADAVTAAAGIVVVTSVGVSAGSVQLQGSLDNVNWFNAGTAVSTATASSVLQSSATTPARFWRANVATGITGGTVDVWVTTA